MTKAKFSEILIVAVLIIYCEYVMYPLTETANEIMKFLYFLSDWKMFFNIIVYLNIKQ